MENRKYCRIEFCNEDWNEDKPDCQCGMKDHEICEYYIGKKAAAKRNKPPNLDDKFKNNHFATAEFIIDGFKVSIYHEISRNKLTKVFYINGESKGLWFDHEAEENKRFAYSLSKLLHNSKQRKACKKLPKKYRPFEPDKRVEYRMFWTTRTIKSILKQWCERDINKSIELVDADWNLIFKYK